MKKISKYLILFAIYLIAILLLSIIYLNTNISYNIISSILIIIYLIMFGSISFLIARKSHKKGIIIGLISGSISVIILFLLSLIFNKFNIRILIYYMLIILSMIFGSIISKNIKK